jgi:hypothetical protein
MPELPAAMLRNGRPEDQEFRPTEYLYRRVPLVHWDDGDDPIEIDAIELPDMSVMRGKYAHPEWTRLHGDECSEWGVIGFQVADIPAHLQHLGVFVWTFCPKHAPQKNNYPHAEVQAFENGLHVNAKDRLDVDLHLRWRELLLWKIRKIIRPHEQVAVRQTSPTPA